MTTMVRQQAVASPTPKAPPGSILDCATVQDMPNLWNNYADGFWPSACGNNRTVDHELCTDPGYTPITKTFDQPTWATAHRFAVYRGLSCRTVGFALGESDVQAAFAADEGRAVGNALWGIYSPLASAVSGGSTGGAVCEFGALVDAAYDGYGGSPVFLLPVQMAIALQADRVLDRGSFSSAFGCVGVCTGNDKDKALALGALVIQRGPLVSQEVFDPVHNDTYLLVERQYQVGVDCDFVASVGATVNCGAAP